MDIWTWSVGVAAGLGALGGGWTVVKAMIRPLWQGFRRERQAIQEVPRLRREVAELRGAGQEALARHEAADAARFQAQSEVLGRLDRKLDLAMRDIRWLCRRSGAMDGDQEGDT